MKKVMICEGLNDGMLIEAIMDKSNFAKSEIRMFHQKSVPMNEKKHAETTILRSFMQDNLYNPYKFLVKLEGGKDSAMKIFCRELVNLTRIDDCILMLDLDTETPEKRIQLLKKAIDHSYSKTTPLELKFERKCEHSHLYHFSCSVFITNNEIGKFQVVFFRVSLENSCSIKKKDSEEIKLKKIKQFMEKEKIQDFFNPIVN